MVLNLIVNRQSSIVNSFGSEHKYNTCININLQLKNLVENPIIILRGDNVVKAKLPLNKQIIYSLGQLGWSILINMISLMLVYFYIPPDEAGIPYFITQITFLGVLNAITLIAASGRLFDAITDPLIAHFSDNLESEQGRRIPFLKFGALPAGIFCFLLFVPLVQGESALNIVWLVVIQILFYLFLTMYVTPFFALLPELANNEQERLNLSTYISITWALGMMLAALLPAIADIIQQTALVSDRVGAFQAAVAILAVIAVILMYLPVLAIDENKYCENKAAKVDLMDALKVIFSNKNFRYYIIADFAYFTGLTIINTGMLYYVTVLLFQTEAFVSFLIPLMAIVSFVFYPFVNFLAKKFGKKNLVVFSFFFMSGVFCFIYFLGKMPISNVLQAYLLVILAGVPIAFLGILPNAILADIAEFDAVKSGNRKEGAFFAARTLLQKLGQTSGIFFFAALTTFGSNQGDDLGIRLSGVLGMILCLLAAIVFMRYKEKKILNKID